jgi:prepilin-type N-terminal cleavage/methylation domain-containing protein
MTYPRKGSGRGFTLVELLVVIAIIGILVALLIPAVSIAVRAVKTNVTAAELDQLAQAMEAYKNKYGEYPPDFTNPLAVVAHMRKAFPRSNSAVVQAWLSNTTLTPLPGNLDPAEAIVVWLGMLKNNPRDPLTGVGESVSLFDFDQTRLTDFDNDGWKEYVPKHAPGAPYVYFDGRVLGGACLYKDAMYPPSTSALVNSLGVARPYRSNIAIDAQDTKTVPKTTGNPTQWVSPNKFQIICAGLDGQFSDPSATPPNGFQADGSTGYPIFKQFPAPNYNVSDQDSDNLTSFAESKTIGDSVP